MTLTDRPTAAPCPRGGWSTSADPAGPRRRSQLTLLLLAVDASVLLAVLVTVDTGELGVAVIGLSLLALHALVGLYRPRLELSVLADLPVLLGASLAAAGLAALVAGVLAPGRVGEDALRASFELVPLLVAGRTAAYAAVRRARRAGRGAQRTLVVGCGGLGAQLAGVLARREHGLLPVGFVDDDPRLPVGERPLPVLGRLVDLPRLVRDQDVEVVLIAYSNVPEAVVVDVLRSCHRLDVEIFAVPRFWQVDSSHRPAEVLRGVPLVRFRRPAFRAASWPLKRVLDVVASAAGLLLLGPVLLACALVVRVGVGPGVLFRQERVGLDGRRFELLKFRTLTASGPAESATRWSVVDHDRLGAAGRWMRRLSLDELPQLWNVLRGDMSLVGPRPERPYFVERFSREHEEYLWRHRVPCGLTGWAQVHGLRGDTSIGERARYDNHYIENWSLWLDVRILLGTVRQVLRATGA